MQVFISWSGPRSKAIAEALSSWLSQTIQLVEPWISTDIDKGKRWGHEVTSRLQTSPVGVICVVPENVSNPWLLFEAGAISNTPDSHVCTFLVGIKATDVPLPLSQFQATIFSREEVKKLLETVNDRLGQSGARPLTQSTLDAVFDNNWPRLETAISTIEAQAAPAQKPRRDAAELLDEALQILRVIERRLPEQSQGLTLSDLGLGLPDPGDPLVAPPIRRGLALPSDPGARRRALAAIAAIGAGNALAMPLGSGGSASTGLTPNALLQPFADPLSTPPTSALPPSSWRPD